jgi:hypothetical protein
MDNKHIGTADTQEGAAKLVDDYIVNTLEMESDNHVGRWPLNFPNNYKPTSARRVINARYRGEAYRLYGQYLTPDDLDPNNDDPTLPPLHSGITPTGDPWQIRWKRLEGKSTAFDNQFPTYPAFQNYLKQTDYSVNVIKRRITRLFEEDGLAPPKLEWER